MESNFRGATTMPKRIVQLETQVAAAQEILGGVIKIRLRLEEMNSRLAGGGSIDKLRTGESAPPAGSMAGLRQAQELTMEEVGRALSQLDELEQLV